ncbi:MAG TPA: TonB-dependent siderophore receptor [Bryobacteraceae bacterium]|jgi:catecholate siderophore receptor|nr:TonB-dependent siderophore receptor [Bryobacteraceae bacterium]
MKTKTPRKKRKNKGSGNDWPVAYRWAAVGTLVAYSAIGSKTYNVAQAQGITGPGEISGAVSQTQGSQPVRRFDIPAGPLDSGLKAFERVTGYKVTLSQQGLGSLASPGVKGLYTPEQALQKVLADTGLTYRFTAAESVFVDLKIAAQSVDVTSRIEAVPSSAKYSAPVLDTPQTVSAVPAQVMEQQGVITLRDALRNVAGISLAAGEGASQGDNLTIRGFTARNDLFIDGMRDFGSYYRDPFDVEEVEVLEGPSSVTFGRGSTGGVVNQSSKAPGLLGFVSGGIDLGTDFTRRATVDIDKPLTLLGSGAAFRLNAMGDMNDVAGRDVAENRRFGIAPSLSLGLGTPTRWTFSYFHQSADDNPDYGIPWLFNGPAPVNRENYYGFQNGNYLRTYDDIGTAKVEHDFRHGITLRDQIRYANYARDVLITEPQAISAVTGAAPVLSTPLSQIVVNRHEIGANSVETMLDEQLDLTVKFETGFLHHSLVTGVEGSKETSDPVRPTWTNVPTTSLFDPNPQQKLSGTDTITSIVHTTALSAAAYVLDTVQLGRKWDVTGGIRWDRFDSSYTQQVAPASAFNRIDEMPSWRAALVYKPVPMGSIYFDAGTSFNPSAESLSLSAATANLPPERNLTYEVGTKWDLGQHHLSLRSALFRTNKYNAREPDPTNPLLDVLAGNERVDGAEFQAQGHLTSRWEMLSSFAYLDSRVVSSQYYPAAIGYPLANVPRYTYNFWSEYHLSKRWEAGAGSNYVSSRTASATAPLDPATGLIKEVPGYWVFNAMVKHSLNEHMDLQVNVNNIANRYYYDELHPGHIVLGPGRSALIGLQFKF